MPIYSEEYRSRSIRTLETALGQVAAYRSWRQVDPGPSHNPDARYAALPILTKQDIRANFPTGMVPSGVDIIGALARHEIDSVKTSGSSDTSVTNVWNQSWWDASEKASWKLNSWADKLADGSHREAILANPLNVGFISDESDLSLEKRRLGRFLYLNEKTDPTAWTPRLMERMAAELDIFKPALLEANPSLLARLCRYLAASNRSVYQPGLIVFTYEYTTRFALRQIQRVFKSPLASSYGTTETGYVLIQCEAGNFHQNSECCRIDFQPLKPEHGGPRLGRILVTTFNNPWYYIVHFDVGDLVSLSSNACGCGRREGLVVSAIEGPAINATLTTQGRLVTQRELDETLSGVDGIDLYKLEQISERGYALHITSQTTGKGLLTEKITMVLKDLYGQAAEVSVQYESDIKPEVTGKYRTSRALFPIDINNFLIGGSSAKQENRSEIP